MPSTKVSPSPSRQETKQIYTISVWSANQVNSYLYMIANIYSDDTLSRNKQTLWNKQIQEKKLTSHSTIIHVSENTNMEYVETSMPIGASPSPNLSQKLNQIIAHREGLLRNLMYVTTFGQVLYNIRPSHMEHFWQYNLTFNGQRRKHYPINLNIFFIQRGKQ